VFVVVAATWNAAVAHAAEIAVLSAGAVKSIVTELAEAFRQETGHTVKFTFAPVGALREKLASGEPADVVIMSDTAIEQLAAQGAVLGDSRTDIAKTAIGVAVREGAPRPDISTPEAFKQTVLAAKSIVYVDPARGATSGIHFASVLDRLGIADAVKGKTVLVPGGFAAESVAKGEAELCVHQISEIIPVKGVTLVGPLPRELQKITVYSAAIPARARIPEEAKAFTAFLARPAWKAKLAAAGLDYRE
jgi:molybdate transport system substrate-binding protein